MKLALAQINPIIGKFSFNIESIKRCLDSAKKEGADLVVFPELAICGYPPQDLVERDEFIDANESAVDEVRRACVGIAAIVGHVSRNKDGRGKPCHNTASFIDDTKLIASYHKALLPTYDVFDEHRYFEAQRKPLVIDWKNRRIGLSICEDAWNDADFWPHALYDYDPMDALVKNGADLIINISASPFALQKKNLRQKMISFQAKKYKIPIAHVNQVGANDELIFDGHSFVIAGNGAVLAEAKGFCEDLVVCDLETNDAIPATTIPVIEQAHDALILGVRDYVRKCGFEKVIIGLSGGIDSAVVAALAVLTLGKENVVGITMPSEYSSSGSVDDSESLARNLEIEVKTIPIATIVDVYMKTLEDDFAGTSFSAAEENIQARIRGNLLMAYSNKFGYLVLSTGNKSELAVGYCTLYGDMSGGLSVIGDLPKTLVYDLARYINAQHNNAIPQCIIDKEPSAELRPNQKDSDSLPAYDILDGILNLYIEQKKSAAEIITAGYDESTVHRILNMVIRNEYKRRQAAITLRISPKAFGSGRRMPIAWQPDTPH